MDNPIGGFRLTQIDQSPSKQPTLTPPFISILTPQNPLMKPRAPVWLRP